MNKIYPDKHGLNNAITVQFKVYFIGRYFMTKAKKESTHTTISIFSRDIMSVISSYSEDEKTKSALAKAHLSFGTSDYQRKRILTRLAQFAAEGKIEQVARLEKIRPDLRQQVLFTLAGLGALNEMKPILTRHPELFLVDAPLTDISGAIFTSITIFRHAVWTGDTYYMCNMMIDCLPKNKKGEALRVALLGQYNEQMENGVDYVLNGENRHETQHSLEPLKEALNTYVTQYRNWTKAQRIKHWSTVVGSEETLQPAIVRYHYCNPKVSFYHKPTFMEAELVRTLQFYNYIDEKYQLWSAACQGLGSNFGITGSTGRGYAEVSRAEARRYGCGTIW